MALLGQRILGLALGYEDVNDHDELRRDRALSTAMGRRVECARSDCEPLAGKSTLNRMELSANGRDRAKARQITVDFGAGYRCHGRETARPELRTSSGDVAGGLVETVEPLVDRLRKRLLHVPILIRADGAYCRDEWMTWCEARSVDDTCWGCRATIGCKTGSSR